MANPNLQKVIKLTQSQYNTLANGGTVGDFTGLNDNYLYLIQEDYEFPTTTTARKILMSTSTAGLVSWESLTANDIPSLDASKINSGVFSTSRIPNLNASKITAGTFDIARIPTGTTASTVALGNHNHNGTYQSASDILTAIDGYITEAFLDGNFGFIKLVDDGHGNPAFIIDTTTYLAKNATAADSSKLNGQAASYYLNYNNLSNTPSSLPASDVYAWAKAATKPTYTASEVGALASDAKVVLYTLQSLSAAQRLIARANIGAGTSDLELGNTATTAAAGNHTHILSIASGGSSPTILAADTTYTLTAGGSTLVFKTPAAGGGSAYYANQYNQWYYFSNGINPNIGSKIGLTNLTTYNYANLFFGFNSIPEDYATSLSNGHNIKTSSRSFIMDFALASGYMSQLVFGTVGYDITKIYARSGNAYGSAVGEPDNVSNLGILYLVGSKLNGSIVYNNSLYEFAIGRKNHSIHFSSGSNHAFFNILNNDFYTYSALYQIASALYNTGHRSTTSFLRASGIYGSYSKPVVGVYASSGSTLWIVYMNGTTVTSSSFTSGNVADSEINTVYEP